MSKTAPAIPFFGDAYLADTRHLSLEEHGAYFQLMLIAWRIEGCCLPDDDARLARMLGTTAAKWRKLKPTVMAFWTLENGAWRQARLTKERKFVEEKRAKNSAAAKSMWEAKSIENKGDDECERNSERNAPPPPPNRSKKERDKPSPSRDRFFRLPADWIPTKPLPANLAAKVAQWPPGSLEDELEALHRWALNAENKPGKGRKIDWDAAWHGWLNRKHKDYSNGHAQPNSGSQINLRGSRPSPALELFRSAEAQRRDEEADSGAWPALSSFGPS